MKRLAPVALWLIVAAPSWAQHTFHGNFARTGVYETPGPARFGSVKWAFKAGGAIVASPAVADGVV